MAQAHEAISRWEKNRGNRGFRKFALEVDPTVKMRSVGHAMAYVFYDGSIALATSRAGSWPRVISKEELADLEALEQFFIDARNLPPKVELKPAQSIHRYFNPDDTTRREDEDDDTTH